MIVPDWPVPPHVRACITTRAEGDVALDDTRRKLRARLPAEPAWLKQVHGKQVIDLDLDPPGEADAGLTRKKNKVCVAQMADCMPVLFSDVEGTVVAAAHAGWRGLAGGVLEATVQAMGVPPEKIVAWMGPAIGPRVYEVGEEVRAAFAGYESALTPNRPGHWLLDLYAVARAKLASLKSVSGGGYCTYSEARFYSYRRDRTRSRMGAFIWLA
jgi:polyphenol oxidase